MPQIPAMPDSLYVCCTVNLSEINCVLLLVSYDEWLLIARRKLLEQEGYRVSSRLRLRETKDHYKFRESKGRFVPRWCRSTSRAGEAAGLRHNNVQKSRSHPDVSSSVNWKEHLKVRNEVVTRMIFLRPAYQSPSTIRPSSAASDLQTGSARSVTGGNRPC